MKMKFATMAVAAVMAAGPVMADLVFPSLSYRTGPYAASGIPFADGYADYFTLLNERDGGIGGAKIRVPECETGYNTEKGVECYESTKGEGALVYQPLSTGITYQLIPKATADGIPIHSMGYGRTSAANGKVFRDVFNYPANYWDGASGAINYLLDENGGDIKGKKIALVYHNSAYGKEPIRTLEELQKTHGFELTLLPVDHPGQEQKSQWLQIRREKPDYVIMWGWGVMNQVAIQEAVNIRYPMENFIGVWWSGSEADVIPAGAAANGYKALTFHGVGKDYPIYDDIQKYVVDTGKAMRRGRPDRDGSVQPWHVRRDAGRRSCENRAGNPRHAGYRRQDDARRYGGAGDHRGEDGRAGSSQLWPRVQGVVRRARWSGPGGCNPVGCSRWHVECHL